MSNKIKFGLLSLIAFIIASILPFAAMAQTDPGNCPDCPIDGGVTLLIGAGVAYGVKKYREGKKN